ncbi:MAG: hypothetical protein EZS28_033980 [Streblomastix strix]|uniref:Uncharacterized protein n=1 Tax=Streblomastix strix TaxID=222440 RepID=A0A5J4UJT9_9EUKA|nr:MAG: hypothetical protein EZS28_033980 [Streblomastix strix]
MLNIRSTCCDCLNQIDSYSGQSEPILVAENYSSAFAINISMCGGCLSERNSDVGSTLGYMTNYFCNLFYPEVFLGGSYPPNSNYGPQSVEQYEEEVAYEEIESQIFNVCYASHDENVQKQALMTKKVLSNLLLDPTNEVDDEDEF